MTVSDIAIRWNITTALVSAYGKLFFDCSSLEEQQMEQSRLNDNFRPVAV